MNQTCVHERNEFRAGNVFCLNGRAKFLLKENPTRKSSTPSRWKETAASKLPPGRRWKAASYLYFGDRAYTNWIAA